MEQKGKKLKNRSRHVKSRGQERVLEEALKQRVSTRMVLKQRLAVLYHVFAIYK